MKGKVYIIGAGPGDPELITLKALNVLRESDIVLYDRLVNLEILRYLKPGTRTIYVGKEKGKQEERHQEILDLLKILAEEGYKVAHLKGGDPFIFGRGAEEALYLLENGIEVEVIPGVSSCTGVPTGALIPVTTRGYSSSFAVISGRRCRGEVNWEDFAKIDTLVILMGVENRECIASELINAGRGPEEPVAFIERGGWKEERVVFSNLKAVSEGKVDVSPPAIMLVGKVLEIGKLLREEVQICKSLMEENLLAG